MEIRNLDNDIKVFYVTAESFPVGIQDAFHKLKSFLKSDDGRKFYGISHGSPDGIIYMAAVEETQEGEGKSLGCETFTIKSGSYICEDIADWKQNVSIIGKTFQKLLKDIRVDNNGYCLEVYLNENDVSCMVKLNS